jgi:murein L,D-transpeptidase YcbB/YkuD
MAGDDAARSQAVREWRSPSHDLRRQPARRARPLPGRNAIDEDGALGSNTLRELNYTVEDRIADLKLNLDRWRWLPRELGARYIVVNVAGSSSS